ncbi:MAG: phosphotransferase [Lachnospiraceae bacterium]|nr:phosphotransferase [Lachnospiraceae bacterium]
MDKVECDGRIGLIYEKLQDKKSIGRLCHDDPLHTRQYAKDFARETVKIHSIKCADKGLKNYKDFYIEELLTGTQDKIYTKKVIDLINDEIEDKDTFIHGDLTVGNIIYSDNKWYWIDLGRMGYGDPLFDLADAYFTFKFLSSLGYVRNLFHMTKSQMIEFFDNFIKEYAYLTSQDCDRLCDRIKRVSVIYAFRMWAKVIKHVPILYQVLHYKAKKYYDDVIGK